MKIFTYVALLVVLVLVFFSGCGGRGIFAMSDEWCEAHGNPVAHCLQVPAYQYRPAPDCLASEYRKSSCTAELPHRRTGLDPQGHLPAGQNPHGPPCPGQYEYRLGSGEFQFCWGRK